VKERILQAEELRQLTAGVQMAVLACSGGMLIEHRWMNASLAVATNHDSLEELGDASTQS